MNSLFKINEVMESGDVVRFHQAVGVTPQKLSEHQWGVAMLLQYFDPDAPKQVLLYALTHDVAELYTGDVPATAKWANPNIKAALDELEDAKMRELGIDFELPSEEYRRLLKVCDCLEGMTYCVKRMQMGESKAIRTFNAWAEFLIKNYYSDLIGLKLEYFQGLLEQVKGDLE